MSHLLFLWICFPPCKTASIGDGKYKYRFEYRKYCFGLDQPFHGGTNLKDHVSVSRNFNVVECDVLVSLH